MVTIEVGYQDKCSTASDIYEHLPTLRKYGSYCQHITELGVRGIVSTWAFLAARPANIVCVDLNHPSESGGNLDETQALAKDERINFIFKQADDRQIELDTTDLLFIDTWHVYEQLKVELALHATKTRRFIILHDTTTYGQQGESPGHAGLLPALSEFLVGEEGANWKVIEQSAACNGLTVLERNGPKIKVVTLFDGNELLARMFVNHYRFADKIHAIVNRPSDGTREALASVQNVKIDDLELPDGLDNTLKVTELNQRIAGLDSQYDWYLVPDSDEFIWPTGNLDACQTRQHLAKISDSVQAVMAKLLSVFRNKIDDDIDPRLLPAFQLTQSQLHGKPAKNLPYQKPIIIRSNRGLAFVPGNHAKITGVQSCLSPMQFDGVKWGNAAQSFAQAGSFETGELG